MSDPAPMHIRPTAPIATDALLPGDPGRALALAQGLLEQPRMCNHHRGLWGYSGSTPAGQELTIQSTGLGGPSIGIVLAELAALGVRRAVRVGTCSALAGGPPLAALIAVEGAIAAEGSSRSLGAAGTATPDPGLHQRLAADGAGPALVASVDVMLPDRDPAPSGTGAGAAEMGSATLFTLGRDLGVAVASVLVVARSATGEALDDERLAVASLELGTLAAGALAG